jgi:hypothetical protein
MMKRDLRMTSATALILFLVQPAARAEPPAAAIADKMAGVTDQLNRTETGKPVQAEQKAIVNDLDQLIASLEKKYERGRGGRKIANPDRGMRDSMISSGPGGSGALVNPADTGADWGQLSSRERDRILQSMSEGFPPEYRTVLERYYRRLAEEKGSTGSKPKAAETPAPKEAETTTPAAKKP